MGVNPSEGGGPGGGGPRGHFHLQFPMLRLACGDPPFLHLQSAPPRHGGLQGLGSVGGPFPRPRRPWAGEGGGERGGRLRGQVRAPGPGPRAEQNPRQEVTRKCSRPPAPPTDGPPKTPGVDNVLEAREGGQPRTCNCPRPRPPPSPRGLGLGGPSPAALPRAPGGKRAVGRSSWSQRRVQPRAKPGTSRRGEQPRHPRRLQAPGRGPPGLTLRSALRFGGPRPRPLRAYEGARKLREPRG